MYTLTECPSRYIIFDQKGLCIACALCCRALVARCAIGIGVGLSSAA